MQNVKFDYASYFEKVRHLEAPQGKLLVSQGDVLNDAFLLLEGNLRIFTLNEEGKEATLYLLNGGEICLFSLNAAFSGGRYPAWVSVESSKAEVALLPAKKLRELFSSETAIQELVLASLTHTVNELLTHLDEVLLCDLPERVLRLLKRQADGQGRVKITHEVMAAHLGVTRESVTRAIKKLKSEDSIAVEKAYLKVSL